MVDAAGDAPQRCAASVVCAACCAPVRCCAAGPTVAETGGSWWAERRFVYFFRMVTLFVFLGLLVGAIIARTYVALADALAVVLVALLMVCTVLVDGAYDGLAMFVSPVYQTVASLSLFFFPAAVYFAVRDHFRHPDIVLPVFTFLAFFLLDVFLLGARARFRFRVAWLPVLADVLAVTVFVSLAMRRTSPQGWLKRRQVRVIVGVYTAFWSVGSAVLAVLLTRIIGRCMFLCRQNDDRSVGAEP